MKTENTSPRVSFIDEAPHLMANTEYALKDAISMGQISLNYDSLDKAINGACHRLRNIESLAAHDRIALYLPNSLELIVYIMAALRLNITVIPINTKYHSATASYIVEQSESRLVLTDFRGSKLFESQHVRIVDGLSFSTDIIWAEDKVPDDLALIYYTSGSTGPPKGVMTSHKNLLLGADSVSHYLNLEIDDKLAAILPLAFDAGLNFVLSGLYVGAQISFVSYLLPKSLIKTIREANITCLLLVPSVYQQAISHIDAPLPALRICASTGGVMPTETIDTLLAIHPQLLFYVMYGLTEAFRSSFLHPADYPQKKGSIGKAIPHAEVFVVNRDGEECEPNERGEIVHCGPLVGLGYLNDAEATMACYRTTPSYSKYYELYDYCVYSGDVGWKDEEGFLYFEGRTDRLIKSKGFRIASEEIEKAIMTHTSYSMCYALGEKHPVHGQIVVIIVESDETPVLKLIQQELRPHISGFMIPDKVMQVSKMPLNSNGKVDEKELRNILELSS